LPAPFSPLASPPWPAPFFVPVCVSVPEHTAYFVLVLEEKKLLGIGARIGHAY